MNFIGKEIIACLSCLAPNNWSIDFCENCGSPIGMTSTLDPLKTIQAEGFLLRKATSERPKFIVLLGIWLLFLPWLGGTSAIAINMMVKGKGVADFIFFLISIALALVAVRVLFLVTHNYLTMPDLKQNKKLKGEKKMINTILIFGKIGIFLGAAILVGSWMTDLFGSNLFWSGLLILFVSFGIKIFLSNSIPTPKRSLKI